MDLTFDNLGEAADLERGLWPADVALGDHPSVRIALPRLLDALDERGLRATFCLEAINAEHYPEAVVAIGARGHEVAMHGWRHERWQDLDAGREAALLARGRAAFGALGLDVRGFRPPGGALTVRGDEPLRAAGFGWTSCAAAAAPAGDRAACLVQRPFAWRRVDAYHRLEAFAGLRAAHGDPEAPADAATTAGRLLGSLGDDALAPRLILHPFLMTDDAGWAAARKVLDAIA